MAIMIDKETKAFEVASGVQRKIIHLNNLMMVVIDFTNGPASKPDLPHSHKHEQISYVAKGELNVFIGGEMSFLKEGDSFSVPCDIPHCIQTLCTHVRLIDTFSPVREGFLL